MISFKNYSSTIDELVSGLVHNSAPTSWNVVLPPVFNEHELGVDLVAELRMRSPAPMVAMVSSDEIQDPRSFVMELHRQWSQTYPLPTPPRDTDPPLALQKLQASLPNNRPVVQILKRFHKILDSLDPYILGAIRTAEQAHKLHTLTIAPYDYDELKKRWENRGKLLILSDYGDTHSLRTVEVLSAKEIEDICAENSIPGHITELALRITGGYPTPFNQIIHEWIRAGKPSNPRAIEAKLRSVGEQQMKRLVKNLDRDGETRYRDAVIDLHHRIEPEEVLATLSLHPWRSLLLSEDGLRAEALGHAAVSAAIQDAVNNTAGGSVVANVTVKARLMYSRSQYDVVLRLFEGLEDKLLPQHLKLLRAHARVMSVLYGGEGEEPGIDTNWSSLRMRVREARQALDAARDKIEMAAEIESRYEELDQIANSILSASKDGNRRVVDALAGCVEPGEAKDPNTALLLLLLRLEAGKAVSGDASACHAVMALPEQIFRVWAAWSLKLSYYTVPEGHTGIWEDVGRAWPTGEFVRPPPGGSFNSFQAFAYFALAMALRSPPEHRAALPEPSLKALNKALSILEVRRDSAHALATSNARLRQQLFGLIDRWFDALLALSSTRGRPVLRDELRAHVEPLPVVDEHYATIWS